MRPVTAHALPDTMPTWLRHPVLRVFVLAASGTVAACVGGVLATGLSFAMPDAHPDAVALDLARIHADLEAYRAFTGDWPESMTEVYGESRPTDPWGMPYVFAPTAGARTAPDVVTFGADRWPGGAGASADHWMSERSGPLSVLPGWGEGRS